MRVPALQDQVSDRGSPIHVRDPALPQSTVCLIFPVQPPVYPQQVCHAAVACRLCLSLLLFLQLL